MSPKKEFIPYLLVFAGIFCLFSMLSFTETDDSGAINWFGRLGYFFAYGALYLLGKSSYLLGLGLLGLGFANFRIKELDIIGKLLLLPILILSVSLALSFLTDHQGNVGDAGGVMGSFLGTILDFTIGSTGKAILTAFILAYSVFAILNDDSVVSSKERLKQYLLKWKDSFSGGKFTLPQWERAKQPNGSSNVRGFNSGTEIRPGKIFSDLFTKRIIKEPRRAVNFLSDEPRLSSVTPQDAMAKTSESKKIFPRYKNTSLYDGFFEEERVFRFHDASVQLKRKYTETADSSTLGFAILDYRSKNDLPEFVDYRDNESELDLTEPYEEEEEELDEEPVEEDIEPIEELVQEPIIQNFSPPAIPKKAINEEELLVKTYVPKVDLKKGGYYISPKLLGEPKIKPFTTETKADSDQVARKIEEIISHYGIQSRVVSMERGPIITRYELTIPNGIKLSKITSLDSELKLYLAVKSIRIVAPIPGKSTIGIEVPNKIREDVHLTDLLRDTSLAKAQGGLNICIGKDIAGRSMNIDLTKLPHLLVAGTTGSGKSVCLNSMVTSLIYSRSPQELRFIMIDPKMVEMTLYEDIPHLLMPVITDPKKATRALGWAIQEMEARYQSVSSLKCRDFQSYNQKVEEWAHKKGYEKMPYIVIVIDELSDLMMVSGKDLEDQITRISQKSRAVGIHLVMATQRPSVDVITGLIKANCPARMAFQVAQKTDSRTILDANGAESLLGKGDFLYRSPTASDLVRVQAPFVTEEEIERIVEESQKFASPGYVDVNLEDEANESTDGFEEDENLIEDAWRVICQEGKASGSMVQRHLRIGYNKAARIIDILEKRGIISAHIGTKPREILKSI
jgi:S-DNA-T family DNA segregation ATPase FtsK/SpoIIIE